MDGLGFAEVLMRDMFLKLMCRSIRDVRSSFKAHEDTGNAETTDCFPLFVLFLRF